VDRLSRRGFLLGSAAVLGARATAGATEPSPAVVNDVHSRLNPTRVLRVVQPASLEALRLSPYVPGYYLTYHRWARRDQLEACYPRVVDFLRLKRRYDPAERFQSDWYRDYRAAFAERL